ncbi:MAG: hypothetical protein J5W83_05305 [Candidatus Accumulibacter sp.]|uniref:hypothetical protein n=1 Tax=Accumulibacter sp. TaxID=2053492 RepID=UPI001B0AD364|nr:hypothetical protein [Accumulibacter sp.]MBO3701946.1 hypothetical protein [Accumulibacter sp.]
MSIHFDNAVVKSYEFRAQPKLVFARGFGPCFVYQVGPRSWPQCGGQDGVEFGFSGGEIVAVHAFAQGSFGGIGGAHRAPVAMAQNLKKALQEALQKLGTVPVADLLRIRLERLMASGRVTERALR